MPEIDQERPYDMSEYLGSYELPELPLGLTLQDHIIDYTERLAGKIEEFRKFYTHTGDVGAFNTARMMQAVYDDLSNIIEFTARELEFERGGDEIRTTHSLDCKTAYVMVYRNGESVHEFAYDKQEFAEWISHQNDLLKEMA